MGGLQRLHVEISKEAERRSSDSLTAWFNETLEILITKTNAKWLKTRCTRDRQRYVTLRREVAGEVRRSNSAWFQQKPGEMERAVLRGKGVGKGLREM